MFCILEWQKFINKSFLGGKLLCVDTFAWKLQIFENFWKLLSIIERLFSFSSPSNTNTHTLENAVHHQKSTERNENILSLDILSFLFFVLVENGPQTNQRRGQRQNFTTEGYRWGLFSIWRPIVPGTTVRQWTLGFPNRNIWREQSKCYAFA